MQKNYNNHITINKKHKFSEKFMHKDTLKMYFGSRVNEHIQQGNIQLPIFDILV